MMYIVAKLPARYGRFHQLQEENYPFRRAFERYLEAISALGLALDADPETTIGIIENALFSGERLPDIPDGDAPVNFRFSVDNPTIENFFASSDLTNKMIVTLVIRMTLRLAEKYGNSLSRLTILIEGLSARDVPEETPVSVPDRKEEPQEADSIRSRIKIAAPAKKAETSIRSESDMLKRLENLTQKGDAMLAEREEQPEEGETVVHTNPALADFL